MTEKIWYYEKSGGSTGPVSEAVMVELIDHGIITKDTLVWRSPLDKWVAAIEVKAFKSKLEEVHTPPPLPQANQQIQNQPDLELPQENNPFQAPSIETPTTQFPTQQNPFESSNQGISIPIDREEEPITLDEPVFDPSAQTHTIGHYEGEDGVYVNQVRPWIRYFARQYDYYFFSLFAVVISLYTIMDPVGLSTMSFVEIFISSVALVFIWIFFEAFFLSRFGTTPGKHIFGISVLDRKEKKLSYGQALGRSFGVWLKGMGMSLPVLILIANILGYVHLTENKVTSWDRDSESVTVHDEYNVFLVIIYPILAFIITAVVGAISVYIT